MNEENEVVMEVWRTVEDFPNYEISNMGRIRNINTGYVLSPGDNGHGYLQVTLCQNGEKKRVYIHRLVGIAFIPNPNNLPQINHRNENRADNRAENLEWISIKDNVNYGTRAERFSLSRGKPVEQYDLAGNYLNTWTGTREAERQTGISQSSISACCLGKRKTAGGFIWKFAKKMD